MGGFFGFGCVFFVFYFRGRGLEGLGTCVDVIFSFS